MATSLPKVTIVPAKPVPSKADLQTLVRAMAVQAGIDPVYMLATAEHESGWAPKAHATDPRDLALGGSVGLFQMSLQTALALDPTATPARLEEPSYNVQLAINLTKQNMQRLGNQGRAYTPNIEQCVKDLYSMHNAGRVFVHPNQELQDHMADVWARYLKWAARTAE